MSVTFRAEAIQYRKVEVICNCKDFNDIPEADCFCCNGTGIWYDEEPCSDFVELNLSNYNAAEVLKVALPEIHYEDLCGSWDSNLQDRAAKNLLKAFNKNKNPLIRESSTEGNFVDCGVDLTRAERQINMLLLVLQNCKKYKCNLIFS